MPREMKLQSKCVHACLCPLPEAFTPNKIIFFILKYFSDQYFYLISAGEIDQ